MKMIKIFSIYMCIELCLKIFALLIYGEFTKEYSYLHSYTKCVCLVSKFIFMWSVCLSN